MVRYAIEHRILHTDLERKAWESRMFQFRAGDLYELFPKLREKYMASQESNGNCRPLTDGLSIHKSDKNAFNVSILFTCELNVYKEKVTDW